MLFLIRYVPDWYKTQEICDIVILEAGGILKSFSYKTSDCYKNKKCVMRLLIIIHVH